MYRRTSWLREWVDKAGCNSTSSAVCTIPITRAYTSWAVVVQCARVRADKRCGEELPTLAGCSRFVPQGFGIMECS
jgi:hypothetical protein